MRPCKKKREPKLPLYKNLYNVVESQEFQVISKKEERLIRHDKLLTRLLIGFLLISVALIAFLTVIMAEAQGDMSQFSNTVFASKLFDVLRSTQGNVFFSPYSLQVALAMTYAGASGNTAKELQKALAFSENKETVYKAVKASAEALKSSKDVTLNIANGMFTAKDYQIKAGFANNLKTVFDANAATLDFEDAAAAAKEINDYVVKNTNGKILDLFTPDAFNRMTRMVLVNAIYFKGAWVNKFDPEDTFKGDFFVNAKDKVKVDYMTVTKRFNVVENSALKANIVELPYEGELSMVLIVPTEVEGIKHLESHLHKVDLKTITDDASSQEVHLTMPKFKLEQKIELADPLKKIGIKDMFDSSKASFEGISDLKDLYVSKVVQKAFIEVNEEGSEASAATGITIVTFSMPMPPVELLVDRPFVFYILHKPSDSPLFFGRVSKFS